MAFPKKPGWKLETGQREWAPTLWTAPRAGLSPDTPIVLGIITVIFLNVS